MEALGSCSGCRVNPGGGRELDELVLEVAADVREARYGAFARHFAYAVLAYLPGGRGLADMRYNQPEWFASEDRRAGQWKQEHVRSVGMLCRAFAVFCYRGFGGVNKS